METLEQRTDSTDPVNLPSTAESDDEHSGLHEIKALAGAARKRITRRRITENDLQDSLLSSSSAGMSAVVLPDPEKSTPGIPHLTSPSLSSEFAASTSASFGAGITERRQGMPWLWVAAGATVLAAAVAVVVVTQMSAKGTVASSDQGAAKGAANEANGEREAPAAAAQPGEPMIAALDPEPPEPELEPEGEGRDSVDGEVVAAADLAADPDDGAAPPADKSGERLARGAVRSTNKNARDKDGDQRGGGAASAADRKIDLGAASTKGGAKDIGETDGKKESGERGNDINSILDEVTGGKAETKEQVEEVKKADKKRLDSRDVRKAMSGIGGKISNCQKKTGFTGRVSASFKVSTTGKVTSAKASGADGKVVRCVEAAVRSASFPSFEPPLRSFSYSFLLTD